MTRRHIQWPALLLMVLLAGVGTARAQQIELDRESLASSPSLLGEWLYGPARGDLTLATPPSELRATARTQLARGAVPDDWKGAGWFALDLILAPDLEGELLGLTLPRHYGASRVFLDDRLLAVTGELGVDPDRLQPARRPDPILFEAPDAGRHRLSILFVNPEVDRYHRVGFPGGFTVRVHTAESAARSSRLLERGVATRRALFTSVFLAFAVLHFLLFVFRRSSRGNLYFSFFCLSLAALVFLLVHKQLAPDPRIVFWTEAGMNLAGLAFAAFGLLFVHEVFNRRAPAPLRAFLVVLALAVPWVVARPGDSLAAVFFAMLLGLIEMSRCVLAAVVRGRDGARIVGLGVLSLLAGFGSGLLANLGVLPRIDLLTFLAPFVSMLVLIVTMSIYLSRRYARTHLALEEQLRRVRELSEQQLAQERREREQEVRTKLLEAEVERKAQELEEARRLQLSMLPQEIPEHPRVEIAAHMSTATEVGGDYYDFAVGDDDTLTVAVGDATGHGLRAGTMVTATKSLFNALGGDDDMLEIVSRSNLALKRMNLRNLNMALLLARLEGDRLRVAAAGMPQPLVYRARTDSVETLEIGGMPLGALATFPYRAIETSLTTGDVVLFMSDGYPERLDPQDEELGYDAAARSFGEVGDLPADQIVSRLVEHGERWADGREADDDVTFVVLRVR